MTSENSDTPILAANEQLAYLNQFTDRFQLPIWPVLAVYWEVLRLLPLSTQITGQKLSLIYITRTAVSDVCLHTCSGVCLFVAFFTSDCSPSTVATCSSRLYIFSHTHECIAICPTSRILALGFSTCYLQNASESKDKLLSLLLHYIILYSSRREIKVVVRSHALEHNKKIKKNCTQHLSNSKSWNTHTPTHPHTHIVRESDRGTPTYTPCPYQIYNFHLKQSLGP